MKKLDINPLLNAYESFFHALEFAEMIESGNLDNIDHGDEFARTLLIHHFEYTYELSWKMMKKFIEINSGKVESSTRKGLFREAGENELIDDFNKWTEFHNARNLSTHVYDEEVAKEVYATAKEFNAYVKKFISILKEKIQDI